MRKYKLIDKLAKVMRKYESFYDKNTKIVVVICLLVLALCFSWLYLMWCSWENTSYERENESLRKDIRELQKQKDEQEKRYWRELDEKQTSSELKKESQEGKTLVSDVSNPFFSYMHYNAITDSSTPQYRMKLKSSTGEHAIREFDNKYCVATGSALGKVGTTYEMKMKNGNTLELIKAEEKADKDVRADGVVTIDDGSIIEFLVDYNCLENNVSTYGSLSILPEFKGDIEYIKETGNVEV